MTITELLLHVPHEKILCKELYKYSRAHYYNMRYSASQNILNKITLLWQGYMYDLYMCTFANFSKNDFLD